MEQSTRYMFNPAKVAALPRSRMSPFTPQALLRTGMHQHVVQATNTRCGP